MLQIGFVAREPPGRADQRHCSQRVGGWRHDRLPPRRGDLGIARDSWRRFFHRVQSPASACCM